MTSPNWSSKQIIHKLVRDTHQFTLKLTKHQ